MVDAKAAELALEARRARIAETEDRATSESEVVQKLETELFRILANDKSRK